MKKLVAFMSLVVCTSSFASSQCSNEAKLRLNEVINHSVTNIVRLEGSIRLEPKDETMIFGEEVWNSTSNPVEIHIFRLNTSGITHRMQVKMSLPKCKLISIHDHGLPL